jgi:hypothetical protein
VCSIPGCGRKRSARGWCKRHYNHWLLYGDPIAEMDKPLHERLVGMWSVDGECWVWKGSHTNRGYGVVNWTRLGLIQVVAHRVVYEALVGSIPEGLELRHSCDNPSCVNPSHLLPGTHAENMKDMADRNRSPYLNGTHCQRGHDLSLPNAIMPGRKTSCHECHKDKSRERQRKLREITRISKVSN